MAVVIFWLGGFTFYAGVVIPTAHGVLGSHREVGFITQAVTFWINVSGGVAAVLLLVNLWRMDRSMRWLCRSAWATWSVITVAQVALVVLHPALDGMLDAKDHEFLDRAGFHHLHRIYLIIATVQWCATLPHVGLLFVAWQSQDRSTTLARSLQ
ncbi:MAG: hypothetical protein H0X38_11350 [Planctomycetes bacterium]|nr:hypothetical protein [Planctomycetota bacterium]